MELQELRKVELKNETITTLVDKIEKNNKSLVESINLINQELATGNKQTHELLSNIAGVLKSIDRKTQ